ncbi:hypothetical protein ACXXDK_17900 (plasmid) [Deinococcus sp. PESE-38]
MLAYHVRPLGETAREAALAREAAWSPGDPALSGIVSRSPDDEPVDLPHAPLLYALGANGPVGMAAVRELMRRHLADITRWRHPLIIAVPVLTIELQMGLAQLQRRAAPGYASTPQAPTLIPMQVPRLVTVPVGGPSAATSVAPPARDGGNGQPGW